MGPPRDCARGCVYLRTRSCCTTRAAAASRGTARDSDLSDLGARLVRAAGGRLRGVVSNGFVLDVGKLLTGTAGGRLIALAALPLAARLYSPEDFAALATYLGVVLMASAAACLRLEVAIPMAETDDDAANLLVLSLTSAAGVGLTFLAAVLLMPSSLAAILGRPEFAAWLWIIPLGLIMQASYSALTFWATRARRFGSIATTRITQAALGTTTLLVLGWAGIAPLGLLIGSMLSTGSGGIKLVLEFLRRDRHLFEHVSTSTLLDAFNRYRRYPMYSAPEALANVAGIQLPVVLIGATAGAEAGFLILATQITAAPMTLLGTSVAQVYLSRAPEELASRRLAAFTLEVVRRLMQIGTGPLLFVGMMAPVMFPLLLGQNWTRAGEIVGLLVPWITLQFLASPVSMVLHLTGRQHWAMTLQITGLLLRLGAVMAATVWWPAAVVPALAGAAAAFYAIYLIINLRAAGASFGSAARALTPALIFAAPWVILGALLRSTMALLM